MRRGFMLCFLLFCTACGMTHHAPPPAPMAATAPSVCRIGPNDGPVLAERGIGGTGLPLFNAGIPATGVAPALPAAQDRGIGGTGAPRPAPANTGIVGEITGFASVCLNGVEVAYDPATAIAIDGQAESPDAMRAGQIAAIVAGPQANAGGSLIATTVSIRHEVAGPVSAVGSGTLMVAGQAVTLNAGTRGLKQVVPGDWIAVSGFRDDNGVVAATRIDPQTPGIVTVHGDIVAKWDGFWIGGLRLDLPPGAPRLLENEAVTATGVLNGAELDVAAIAPDLLYSNPQAYFGPDIRRLLIESYAFTLGGAVHFATGASIDVLRGGGPFDHLRPGIWSLVRLPGGTLQAAGHMFGGGMGGLGGPGGMGGFGGPGGFGGGLPPP